MKQHVIRLLEEKIIRHFRETKAPVNEVALGTAVGVFWGFTPLIGIQMSLVLTQWFLFRLVGIRFTVPIAVALVWITNPLTMPFFYSLFYIIGKYVIEFVSPGTDMMSFAELMALLKKAEGMGFWDGSLFWTKLVFNEMGLPMMVGGITLGTPLSVISYYAILPILVHHRQKLAEKEGLSYEEWNERHVRV